MILGKISINENESILEKQNKIQNLYLHYVKNVFNNSEKYKETLIRLNKIEDYIKNKYDLTINIRDIIYRIIIHIKIHNNGLIYIDEFKIEKKVSGSQIYQIITFGTLNVTKSAIFNDAFSYVCSKLKGN